MLKKLVSIAAALMLVVGVVSVASAQDCAKAPANVKHVIWIGSDGFGAHYVNWDELPNLKKMRDAGAWSLHMRSVLPSSSAINWETQLVGAPSESHGYRDWGSKEPDLPPIYLNEHGRFPCIYRVLRDALPEARLTVDYNWDGVGFLYDKEAPSEEKNCASDPEVLATALEQLADEPTFAFIYFSEPDGTGHGIGWGTPEYQAMLTTIDGYVGEILNFLEEKDMMKDTVVLFTADHGGSEKGHGGPLMEHMEVPLLFYGQGVKQGEITDTVVHYDVASTIAWLLGVAQPQCWRGMPVVSAFNAE